MRCTVSMIQRWEEPSDHPSRTGCNLIRSSDPTYTFTIIYNHLHIYIYIYLKHWSNTSDTRQKSCYHLLITDPMVYLSLSSTTFNDIQRPMTPCVGPNMWHPGSPARRSKQPQGIGGWMSTDWKERPTNPPIESETCMKGENTINKKETSRIATPSDWEFYEILKLGCWFDPPVHRSSDLILDYWILPAWTHAPKRHLCSKIFHLTQPQTLRPKIRSTFFQVYKHESYIVIQ